MPTRSLKFAATLAAIQLVAADFAGSIESVSSLAVGLSSQVNAWSSPQGLIAALGIQNAFPTLSSAVVALSSAGESISDSDIDPANTSALATSIANLLDALTSKATDFSSVGGQQIVQNDVSSLQGPSVAIVQDIVNAVSGDCAKIGSLTDALNSIANGFSSADSAYSLSVSSFPAIPSCTASSSVPSSLAASSAVSSAATVTSAAVVPTSAASYAATTSAAVTSVAPTSSSPSSPSSVPTVFAQPASVVSSLAVALSSSVDAWSAGQGIIAALGIQNAFPGLSSAVATLSNAANSISDADIDPAGTNALATSIANLLNALTSKAADFSSVGAQQIVQNDVSSLQGPSVAIVQDIINAVSNDCSKIGSLTSALGDIASAFSSADSAYTISASSFPAVPSCGSGGGGSGGGGNSSTPTAGPTASTTTSAACRSTVTNQGFSCSANSGAFGLWNAANQAIHTLLQDVSQAANAIGLGFISDLATLATTLVNALGSARTHLANLECLVPSQAADFFAGVTQTITGLTDLLTGLNKAPGILKIIPGATDVVQLVLQTAVSAFNSYISDISSFLQGFPGNYPCSGITTANGALALLNDALTALNSVLGINVPAVTTIKVTNCRNPTTVITTACVATSAA